MKTTKTAPKTKVAKPKKTASSTTSLRFVAKASAKPAAKKAAPKKSSAKAKAKAKPAPKAKAAAKKTAAAPAAPGTNVFWKFLEMKEARRKQIADKPATQADSGTKEGGRVHQFARFAGPRRRTV